MSTTIDIDAVESLVAEGGGRLLRLHVRDATDSDIMVRLFADKDGEAMAGRFERAAKALNEIFASAATHGSRELDDDAAKLRAQGQDPGPTFADLGLDRPSPNYDTTFERDMDRPPRWHR